MRRVFRVFLLLSMMLAGLGVAAITPFVTAATAQTTGTIEVHLRMCDEVPADGDWYGACHDDAAAGIYVEALNVDTGAIVSGTTDGSGNLVFTLEAGTWQIIGPPGDFLEESFIYCSNGEGMPRIDHPVALAAGQAAVCDYYFVPDDSSGAGTIEVHARMCDSVPANDDWYGTCHDDLAPNVYFDAFETTTGENYFGTTGASGNLTFTLPPGTWQLSGPPGDFLKETFIYCSYGENTARIPHPVTLNAGDAVTCDYYFVPEPQGPTATVPAPTAVPTAVPPTPGPTAVPPQALLELPVVLVMGNCENVMNATEIAAELSDARILQGTAQGSVDAIQAATSYTLVQISLATIVGDDHVIAVLDEDGQEVVACGAVGGVPDAQGAFTIGLAPVDDSGVAGTAYLAGRSGGSTGISIFVVPDGLMPEEILEPVG